MELKKFISTALLSITEGVSDANETSERFQLSGDTHYRKDIGGQLVEFDIVVETSELSEISGKAGINVKVLDVGGNKKSAENNQSTNRLKFKVFITEK